MVGTPDKVKPRISRILLRLGSRRNFEWQGLLFLGLRARRLGQSVAIRGFRRFLQEIPSLRRVLVETGGLEGFEKSVVKLAFMKHEEITKEIINAAFAVLNELKPGLDEKLYENALVLELAARGHLAEQQREYPVRYRGHLIGKLVPDLIVDGKVIVDPKVVSAFNDIHVAKMLGYLTITDLEVALLLNFKEATLTWKRVVRGPTENRSSPK
jgi:GxxExxY protein